MATIAAGSAVAPRPKKSTSHIPSLDGLRAISILLVLLGHLSNTHGFLHVDLGIGDYAHLGVVVFFIISGFLITRLLVGEYDKTQTISLKRFYLRRTLRLFPASYALIACVALLWLAGIVELHSSDIWHALTYTMNYLPGRSWSLGHLWSLSIEEQFYLLWPFAFVFLRPRRAFWAAGWAIVLGPVARAGGWLLLHKTPYNGLELFPMAADSLATGCLLARISGWLEEQPWYLRLFRPAWSLGILGLLLLVNRYLQHIPVWVLGASVVNICIAVLIHRSVYCSRDFFGNFLNWKPIAFIGVLSYSLYLWQQLFLNRFSTAWRCAFPQNLVFVFLAALASYLLLELPVLKLRQRLRV